MANQKFFFLITICITITILQPTLAQAHLYNPQLILAYSEAFNSTAILIAINEFRRFSLSSKVVLNTISVDYKLMLIIDDSVDLCPIPNTDNKIGSSDVQECIDYIGTFKYRYDTSKPKGYDYCGMNSDKVGQLNDNTTHIFIGNLLPDQYYFFNVTLTTPQGLIIYTETGGNCTKPSEPLYPPQTDLGSFELIPKHDLQLQDRLVLYWQLVPRMFMGSKDSQYHVSCSTTIEQPNYRVDKTIRTNNLVYHNQTTSKQVGTVDLPLYNENQSYVCQLTTSNQHGESRNSSLIRIPKKSAMLNTEGNFLIHPIVIQNMYYLRWMDIKDVLNTNDTSILGGIYTIYWCFPIGDVCESIAGMMTSQGTNMTLDIGQKQTSPIKFGISYSTRNLDKFTGISWSECNDATDHELYAKTKVIIDNAKSMRDHTSLQIKFHLDPCQSLSTFVLGYNITYCNVGPVDPCSTGIEKEKLPENLTNSFDYDNLNECRFEIINRSLSTSILLENLTPSSRYAIRIQYMTIINHISIWNATAFAYTDDVPEACRPRPLYIIFMFCVITFAGLVIFQTRAKKYLILALKFHKATATLPIRLGDILRPDEVSRKGIRYWKQLEKDTLHETDSYDGSESSPYEYKIDTETNIVTREKKHANQLENPYVIMDESRNDDNNNYSDYVCPKDMSNNTSVDLVPIELCGFTQDGDVIEDYDGYSTNSESISGSSQSSFLDNILSEIIQAKHH